MYFCVSSLLAAWKKNVLSKLSFSLQLFDYIASFIYRFLRERGLLNTAEPLPLGFTFAFPCKRLALNRAILTRWTKSLHCEGVEGQEVVGLLEKAIEKKGVSKSDLVVLSFCFFLR